MAVCYACGRDMCGHARGYCYYKLDQVRAAALFDPTTFKVKPVTSGKFSCSRSSKTSKIVVTWNGVAHGQKGTSVLEMGAQAIFAGYKVKSNDKLAQLAQMLEDGPGEFAPMMKKLMSAMEDEYIRRETLAAAAKAAAGLESGSAVFDQRKSIRRATTPPTVCPRASSPDVPQQLPTPDPTPRRVKRTNQLPVLPTPNLAPADTVVTLANSPPASPPPLPTPASTPRRIQRTNQLYVAPSAIKPESPSLDRTECSIDSSPVPASSATRPVNFLSVRGKDPLHELWGRNVEGTYSIEGRAADSESTQPVAPLTLELFKLTSDDPLARAHLVGKLVSQDTVAYLEVQEVMCVNEFRSQTQLRCKVVWKPLRASPAYRPVGGWMDLLYKYDGAALKEIAVKGILRTDGLSTYFPFKGVKTRCRGSYDEQWINWWNNLPIRD